MLPSLSGRWAQRALLKGRGFGYCIARDHLGALAATLSGIPTVYLVPGIVAQQHRPRGMNPLRWANHMLSRACQTLAVRKVRRVAVFSQVMATAVTRMGPVEDPLVVKPGIDGVRFHPVSEAERARTRAEWGVPRDAPVALGLGRLAHQKRFDLAIRAMVDLPQSWYLVLIGDGPLRRDLEQMAEGYGVATRVRFTGRTDEPGVCLGAADILVLSSDYEPLGQVLLEAMACGLPVAAFDPAIQEVNTATHEVVPEGYLATAKRLDPAVLAEAMVAARALNIDREELARRTADAFSWGRLLEELESAVVDAVAAKDPTPSGRPG